jgi:hypothetical protein
VGITLVVIQEVFTWLIVDIKSNLIQKNDNALRLTQLDTQLLSILIKIAESAEHRQSWVSSQFEVFKQFPSAWRDKSGNIDPCKRVGAASTKFRGSS